MVLAADVNVYFAYDRLYIIFMIDINVYRLYNRCPNSWSLEQKLMFIHLTIVVNHPYDICYCLLSLRHIVLATEINVHGPYKR